MYSLLYSVHCSICFGW